jgi:hypothetical protein
MGQKNSAPFYVYFEPFYVYFDALFTKIVCRRQRVLKTFLSSPVTGTRT